MSKKHNKRQLKKLDKKLGKTSWVVLDQCYTITQGTLHFVEFDPIKEEMADLDKSIPKHKKTNKPKPL